MRSWIAVLIVASSLVGAGCMKDKDDDMHDSKMMDTKPMTQAKPMAGHETMMDACSHCPGVQTATADGKCPVCGMPVASMAK